MREYVEERTLLTRDVDYMSRIKASAVLDIFQEIASRGAEGLGLGYNDMMRRGMFWVLSRIKFKMCDHLTYLDKIDARTWPRKSGGVFFERDYQLIKNGNIAVSASGMWCVLDAETHRLLPAKKLNLFDIDFITEEALGEKLSKIPTDGIFEHRYSRKVLPSDLDFNRHVNNTKYADFVIDSLPNDFADKRISAMQINYLRETRLDEIIDTEYYTDGNAVNVFGRSGDDNVFESRVEF